MKCRKQKRAPIFVFFRPKSKLGKNQKFSKIEILIMSKIENVPKIENFPKLKSELGRKFSEN